MVAQTRSPTVLLVEDDEIDAMAVKRAFKKGRFDCPILHATDGIEALAVLRGEGCEPVPRPFVMLLDLNMPRMGGFALIDELRSDPDFADVAIFVLTTSNDDRDRSAAEQRQVAGYLVKTQIADDYTILFDALRRHGLMPPQA